MRIFVSIRFTNQGLGRYIASSLKADGHEITSDWLDGPETPEDKLTPNEKVSWACKDLADVRRSDLLLLIAPTDSGGIWVEMGAALAWGVKVVVVPERNVQPGLFCYHPGVALARDFKEAFAYIAWEERRL